MNNTAHNEVAVRITDCMASAERSQQWTADKSGMAYSTFRRKLASDIPVFTVHELARIASALNVSPSVLLPAEFREAA